MNKKQKMKACQNLAQNYGSRILNASLFPMEISGRSGILVSVYFTLCLELVYAEYLESIGLATVGEI